jgi:hypothetical protein
LYLQFTLKVWNSSVGIVNRLGLTHRKT